jgi:hypothetical protein
MEPLVVPVAYQFVLSGASAEKSALVGHTFWPISHTKHSKKVSLTLLLLV